MMFATCDRTLALGFLKNAYQSTTIEDTSEDAGPLLDLVAADVVRVQDPAFHQPCQIVQGQKWNDSLHTVVAAVCQEFHDRHTATENRP